MKSSTEPAAADSAAGAIGVFGGTFDPVHLGHLRLAEEALDTFNLATVRWVPAAQPYHRSSQPVNAAERLAMVRLALAGNPRFVVDVAEIDQGTPTYSVPTLERLRGELGGQRPLLLLVGADAFAGLASWHRWQELFTLAHIAIAHRPGWVLDPASLPAALAREYLDRQVAGDEVSAALQAPAGRIVSFAMTQLAISATALRGLLASGASVRYLLPDEVIAYIRRHALYRTI